MQPFSRETILDRRQTYVRWTAVVAGALVAIGTWMLLQLLLTGGALSSIDPDELDNVRAFGVGTTIGSVLAPLIAMFVGGLVAGRLAGHLDRKVSGLHGVLVWTITSIVGLTLLASAVGAMARGSDITAHHGGSFAAPAIGSGELVDSHLDSINRRLKQQNAPTLDKSEFLDAAHHSTYGRNAFDRDRFVARLSAKSSLSRPEAEAVLAHLGNRSGEVMSAASQVAEHRLRAMAAAEDAGNAMFGAGIGLLLCLIAAAGGGVLGANLVRGARRRDDGNIREGGPHTTAPYPTVTPEREGV
jgi:hypothetical protein